MCSRDLLSEISSQDRRARDFTYSVLRNAIREVIACFPVYRTYIDEQGNVTERDRRYIQQAIASRETPQRDHGACGFRLPAKHLAAEGQ